MSQTDEQHLAALLRVLRPAPAAWVAAACEIPRLERELEHPPAAEPGPSEAPGVQDRVQPRGEDR